MPGSSATTVCGGRDPATKAVNGEDISGEGCEWPGMSPAAD